MFLPQVLLVIEGRGIDSRKTTGRGQREQSFPFFGSLLASGCLSSLRFACASIDRALAVPSFAFRSCVAGLRAPVLSGLILVSLRASLQTRTTARCCRPALTPQGPLFRYPAHCDTRTASRVCWWRLPREWVASQLGPAMPKLELPLAGCHSPRASAAPALRSVPCRRARESKRSPSRPAADLRTPRNDLALCPLSLRPLAAFSLPLGDSLCRS